jgi:glycosyltransferase involved in cell wall biosynthesis
MKILVIAHGHPKFSPGGGEVAAYSMYKALKKAGNEAYFLAWNNTAGAGDMGRPIEQITSDEWMISTKTEFFTFSSINEEAINAYKVLLESLKPDIVHFHHFIHLGIELPKLTKSILTKVKVFMTLHEYLLICANNGQMITTKGELCYQSSPEACNKCFPQKTPESFFMREGYIKNCLAAVDHFFSPSEFLRGRFIQWGLPTEKITYLENILSLDVLTSKKVKPELIKEFGYFGQINYYKGLDILLDAFVIMKKTAPDARLHINGHISEINSPEYRKLLEQKIQELGNSVMFNGTYNKETLKARMDQVGWLVMSSRWWENAPVVIQEAWANKLPIIVPNIGGMLESAEIQEGGVAYEARNVESLARELTEASKMSMSDYGTIAKELPKYNDKKLLLQLIYLYKKV